MNNDKVVDSSAFGSDVARSRLQYWARRAADLIVAGLRLNGGGFLSTEIVQKISPVLKIPIRAGILKCRGGHGRLRWRMETFFTEEPETIRWLDSLTANDVLWDVGANVGLYGIYAALQAGCRVIAFEPEAQNFALLSENILLNGVQERIIATNTPLTRATGFGILHVRILTKGGAYNQFATGSGVEHTCELKDKPAAIKQLQMGFAIDDLLARHGFPFPSHIKIDVDGNEPDIVAGATATLGDPRLKSVLIEIAPNDSAHRAILDMLRKMGFEIVSRRSNWDSRVDKTGQTERPHENVIFRR